MSKAIMGTAQATSKKLGEIHDMVNSNLSEVKKQLHEASLELTAARLEVAGYRKDIEFMKKQMIDFGVEPVGNREKVNARPKKGKARAKC